MLNSSNTPKKKHQANPQYSYRPTQNTIVSLVYEQSNEQSDEDW